MAKLLYQGHGSFRITAEDQTVLYVDPYAGEGYNLPADLVLVTHGHSDHNQISLIRPKNDCVILTHREALAGGSYHTFRTHGFVIQAVPACNQNHKREECVGYIISIDGITLYAAGDTSSTDAMEELLPSLHLDYALLPIDGVYNMDALEAAQCARKIGARYNIPIHMKPGALFDRACAERFDAPNRLIVEAGTEIPL